MVTQVPGLPGASSDHWPRRAIARKFHLVLASQLGDNPAVGPGPLDVDLHPVAEPILPVRVILSRGRSDATHLRRIILGDLNAVGEDAIGIPVDRKNLGGGPTESGHYFDGVAYLKCSSSGWSDVRNYGIILRLSSWIKFDSVLSSETRSVRCERPQY